MEIWKEIKEYEDLYQVSNLGRVKSLARYIKKGETQRYIKERILAGGNNRGYKQVILTKESKGKGFMIHTLVWDYFGDKPRNGRILQVDHINNNKTDNNINNLTLLNNRQNVSKSYLTKEKTSKYTGVCFYKKTGKWVANAMIDGQPKFLGYYTTELQAHLAYQKALIRS